MLFHGLSPGQLWPEYPVFQNPPHSPGLWVGAGGAQFGQRLLCVLGKWGPGRLPKRGQHLQSAGVERALNASLKNLVFLKHHV